MISKLPRWAFYGSAALALIAGMINAVGFLSFQHQGVTHLTGTTTLLGIAAATGDFVGAGHLVLVVLAFVAGCALSGALIRDPALKLGRHYGSALALESMLLFAAALLMGRSHALGACLASSACGLQNGMASTYSGAVLRTTHVSGAFTDLGIFLGQSLRGMEIDRRRLKLMSVIVGSFGLGAGLGAVGFNHVAHRILYVPAVATGVVGAIYGLALHGRREGR